MAKKPLARVRDDEERPRPRVRRTSDERRAELIALGVRVFSERAYDECSIDDVAAEAGISKGLLYHYFPTKRDFYVACVREVSKQLLERLQPDATLSPLVQLDLGLKAYLGFVVEHGARYAGLIRSGIGADPEVARIVEQTRETLVKRTIDAAQISGLSSLARLALRGWVGFVEATSLEWAEKREVEGDLLLSLWKTMLVGAIPQAVAAASDTAK